MESLDNKEVFNRLEKVESKLESVEKTVASQAAQYAAQYTDIKVEMGVMSHKLNEASAQAKAYSEMHTKSVTDLSAHLNKELVNVNDAIFKSSMEIQKSQDVLIRALGVDEDPAQAKHVRKNLDFLAALKASSDKRRENIDRALWGLVIGGGGMALWIGFKKLVIGE